MSYVRLVIEGWFILFWVHCLVLLTSVFLKSSSHLIGMEMHTFDFLELEFFVTFMFFSLWWCVWQVVSYMLVIYIEFVLKIWVFNHKDNFCFDLFEIFLSTLIYAWFVESSSLSPKKWWSICFLWVFIFIFYF